ncbi:Firmicu-CTERM sorting domain-containing protein [Ligilactobacillus apodemi]|nr:Firmicu-CTERM sorting domain-containing protein [Ligilactobacillus apodemi]MCR1901725.1 hypothetical protein [Ligilactobacillus apodemi]
MKKWLLPLICFIGILGTPLSVKASSTIMIDGSFDDWAQIPKTDISFSWDSYNYKQMALSVDDNALYLYIDMSPKQGNGYNVLQVANYEFTIGSHHYYIDFRTPSGQTLVTSDLATGQSREFKAYIYEAGNNGVNQLSTASQGIVTRLSSQNFTEIAELRIPLSDFKIDSLASQKITVKNTNLGSQELIIMGASSAPYILAGLGLVFATTLLWFKRDNLTFSRAN